jgi:hypothetical protein
MILPILHIHDFCDMESLFQCGMHVFSSCFMKSAFYDAGSSQVIAQYYQLIRLGYEVSQQIYIYISYLVQIDLLISENVLFMNHTNSLCLPAGIQECYGKLSRKHDGTQRRIGEDRPL